MAGRHHTGSETGRRFREIFSFLKIRSDGRVPGVVYDDSINGGPAVSGSQCDYCMFKVLRLVVYRTSTVVSCHRPLIDRNTNLVCGNPPLPRSSTSVAPPVRPHLSALDPHSAGSSFPRHCVPAQASTCTCLLLLEKPSRRAAGGCACSCMRDANRPTPRS